MEYTELKSVTLALLNARLRVVCEERRRAHPELRTRPKPCRVWPKRAELKPTSALWDLLR